MPNSEIERAIKILDYYRPPKHYDHNKAFDLAITAMQAQIKPACEADDKCVQLEGKIAEVIAQCQFAKKYESGRCRAFASHLLMELLPVRTGYDLAGVDSDLDI